MKLLLTLCFVLALLQPAAAQSNDFFSYQAVIRNPSGALLSNQAVGVRISILQGSAAGAPLYVERHAATTNVNGLLTLAIGGGTAITGNFFYLYWPQTTYFLKTEIDPLGGTSYTISGTTQLLSVPYAMYARVAGTVQGVRVGELYAGGIVFYVWRDAAGTEHGLIASVTDLGTAKWATSVITNAAVGASYSDGAANTTAIVAALGLPAAATTAAGICDAYTSPTGPFTDWYLPSIWELNQLYSQAIAINNVLENDNDPLTNGLNYTDYWSSTITPSSSATVPISNAWRQSFMGTDNTSNDKPGTVGSSTQTSSTLRGVRAIRRF